MRFQCILWLLLCWLNSINLMDRVRFNLTISSLSLIIIHISLFGCLKCLSIAKMSKNRSYIFPQPLLIGFITLQCLFNFELNSGNQCIGYWWEAFETWFHKICAITRGNMIQGKREYWDYLHEICVPPEFCELSSLLCNRDEHDLDLN